MIRLTAATLLAVAVMATETSARTWTSADGRFTVEAELVAVKRGWVKLRKANGKELTVPLTKFGEADRQFVGEQRQPANDLAAATSVKLDAKAEWSKTMQMDGNGKKLPPNLIVAITLSGKPAAEASYFGLLSVEKAEGDNGAAIELGDGYFFEKSLEGFVKIDRKRSFLNKHPDDGVLVPIELKPSAGKITKIAAVEGSVKIRTGGTRKTIEVGGLADKANTAVDDPALKAAGIEQLKLGKITDEALSYEVRGSHEAIYSVAIVDAVGKSLVNGNSRSASGKQVHCELFYSKKLPADATLKITLLTGTREMEVPFSLKDLPVPPSP